MSLMGLGTLCGERECSGMSEWEVNNHVVVIPKFSFQRTFRGPSNLLFLTKVLEA